jgi:hypothetical protein
VENVLCVTTRENAPALRDEQEKRRPSIKAEPAPESNKG